MHIAMEMTLLLLFACSLLTSSAADSDRIISTIYGDIRGTSRETAGNYIHAFNAVA